MADDSGTNNNFNTNNHGRSPTNKKNESRLARSPLSPIGSGKEKKQQKKKAGDDNGKSPKKKETIIPNPKSPRIYTPPPPPPQAAPDGKKEDSITASVDEGTDGGNSNRAVAPAASGAGSAQPPPPPPPMQVMPPVGFIVFGEANDQPPPPMPFNPDLPPPFSLTVETIMTAAKPLVLTVYKIQTIGEVKGQIEAMMNVSEFEIYFNNKKLSPEDSTLEFHGIDKDSKVRLHIKPQSGTSNQVEVNNYLRLTKSMNDLRNLMQAFPQNSQQQNPPKRKRSRTVDDPLLREKQKQEADKSRDKMAKLRERFAQRRGVQEKKKEEKKKKKKTRKQGGIAGQYALPPTKLPKDAFVSNGSKETVGSDPTNLSAEDSSDREKIKTNASSGSITSILEPSHDLGQGPVTNKELLLYFDVPETKNYAEFLATELFEPPSTFGKLEELKKEFKISRCAHCRSKLPLILREMPCRCGKVFCQTHRSPFKHCCAVDWKKVDRIKLEKEVPKSTPVSRKNSDEEIQPKSSYKKFH